MAHLPGVGNNHPDQLWHNNLASLAPAATFHANLHDHDLPSRAGRSTSSIAAVGKVRTRPTSA
jgi:hypothetical protein